MTKQIDLGQLPKVPRRHGIVTKAELELGSYELEWRIRHKLSVAEELSILTMLMQQTLRRIVNDEHRKDDPD